MGLTFHLSAWKHFHLQPYLNPSVLILFHSLVRVGTLFIILSFIFLYTRYYIAHATAIQNRAGSFDLNIL
jgi:hypothetical protein